MGWLDPQPQVNLELDEGEEIRFVGRRHWIELVQTGGAFILIAVVTGGAALFRSVGGGFFVVDPLQRTSLLDPVNIFLLVLAGVLLFLWGRGTAQPASKRRSPVIDPRTVSVIFLIAAAALLVTVWFRMGGGRVFDFHPSFAAPADGWNLVLWVIALLSIGMVIYLYNDWVDDFLLVTNRRVVYDDEQLLVRHIQQQVLIDDIQQVNVRADTYPAHWLGYGTITIRSFAPRRLVFNLAARPREIERAIMGEVSRLRRAQAPDLLRRMIEDQVYGNKPPPQPGPSIHVTPRYGPLPWIFHENPEIQGDQIKWRPAWVFLVIALARPVGSFLLISAALVMLSRLGVLDSAWGIGLWVVALAVCSFWAYWVYEEHQNDVYILNRQGIIDVDRKPFGPENSRRAPLSAIQDISFDVSFIESLLGFGTVVIQTGGASGGNFTFNHVPDPRGVQTTINDYLTDFKKSEKERQLQDALSLIKQYDAVQRSHGEKITRDEIDRLITQQAQALLESKLPALVEREMRTTPPAPGRFRRRRRPTREA